MAYEIRMGLPEMDALWTELQEKYRTSNLDNKEYLRYGKGQDLLLSVQCCSKQHLRCKYNMKEF